MITTVLPSQQCQNSTANNNHQHNDDANTASVPTAAASVAVPTNTSTTVTLLQSLLDAVRTVQTAYGGHRRELATDSDSNVTRLCDLWDSVLSHGLLAAAAAVPPPHSASYSHGNAATAVATALLQTVADRVHEAVAAATATATNQQRACSD